MKILFIIITLILSINIYAQKESETTKIFVRVYNLDGKKIGKGNLVSVSDTALYLRRNKKSIEIPVEDIGFIKTKHSAGNNILVGAASGAITLAVIGAATAPNDGGFLSFNPGEGALIGTVLGSILGAPIGGITALFKNPKTYEINGDMEKLMVFKGIMSLKQIK